MDKAYFKPDAHDLMIRDAKIICLEEENKRMITDLNYAINALIHYSKQSNGYLASAVLNKIVDGGH